MLNNLKNRLTTGWSFMRVVSLCLAILIIAQAITHSEILFAVLGTFLLFQAAFNYGCCGAGECAVNYSNSTNKSSGAAEEVITFNEVK